MVTDFLNNLSWYRLQTELINIRLIKSAIAHPVSVFEAIVKGTSLSVNHNQPVIFHIKNRGHTFRLKNQEKILLDILFFLSSEDDVLKWKEGFIDYLKDEETGKNFDVLFISAPQLRTLNNLYDEIGEIPEKGEVCLDFLMPLHFNREKDKSRTFLSKNTFVNAFLSRIKRLFGVDIKYSFSKNFDILPYYWRYTEIKHASYSQKGHIQYINGCVGKLYIKGNLSEVSPFLVLGSEIHAGVKLSNSFGYYILQIDPQSYFDRRILNRGAVISVIQDVLERYDVSDMVSKECKPTGKSNIDTLLNEDKLADQIVSDLIAGTYTPEPNTAFRIKKKDGTFRLIEQLSLKDLIVSQLLLKFLSEPFDRILEESSIGFRKGISRERAIELFEIAVKEGYHYVIESDIEDFFPSVSLEILNILIDHYIPSKDIITKTTIKKLLTNGYYESNTYHPRTKGLAQGNPLSPLFANLYLDTFDEQIAGMNLRLIRYADDFVILTKSKAEAEEALLKTESFLSDLGMRLKKEKTAIKSVFDGFEFLGLQFKKGEVIAISGETVRRFKKPLYITEPYVFISLNGDTISIKKNGQTIESLPIRRLSEIMAMGNVALSSSLIKKCTEWNIPLTLTLGSGYFVTTIKPETKAHFDISYQQANKYYNLSDAMRHEIAKDIVLSKLENYKTLFRSKRLSSDAPIFHAIDRALNSVNLSTDLNELRGIEGITSKMFFGALNTLIDNPAFHIKHRRRESPDRINSLLNLAHYVIFSRINATIRSVGLNPYLGFLHAPENRYESLAADIQEPFRAQTEGIIIKILNMNMIKEDDFTETEKGFYLRKNAIKTFLNIFEAELDRKSKKNTVSIKDEIYSQIIRVKQYMIMDEALIFYRWKGQ
ncbi:CRISPR-associated endonuclease Cas1 [hot springs metagenome]|uniref:CRISPR-associated endonuclease Cas1 n=1 Tax=hot springs metagenome TaxID=433727 RepID=A0A5J4L9W4_9ZZZZ